MVERRGREDGEAGAGDAAGAADDPALIVAAMLGPAGFEALDARVRAALASTREPPAVRGGGYVVDALEAALWALRTTRTFEEGLLAAVNLGDDADTTAAIYGQLAGARYGVEAFRSTGASGCSTATRSSRSPTRCSTCACVRFAPR